MSIWKLRWKKLAVIVSIDLYLCLLRFENKCEFCKRVSVFGAVIIKLSVGVECLNYIRRYPQCCEADDYMCGSHEMWNPGDLQRWWWTDWWRVPCFYISWSSSFAAFLYLAPAQCFILCCSGSDFYIILSHLSVSCYMLGTCYILYIFLVPAV